MTRATRSASFPPRMLELLLRVGSNQNYSFTAPTPDKRTAEGLRATFYALRTALRRENYPEIDVVTSVRFRIKPDGLGLIIEGVAKLAKPDMETALDGAMMILDSMDITSNVALNDTGLPSAIPGTRPISAQHATAMLAGPVIPSPDSGDLAEEAALAALNRDAGIPELSHGPK